jgi:hypothetical protein
MSEGGTVKAQLEEVTRQLMEEERKWTENGLNINQNWRMGNGEFLTRCEVIALTRIVKEKLDLSDDEMTLVLRKVTLEQMRQLLPIFLEARRDMLRRQIIDGR